jgi:S1-C subfamily serine protease
MQDYMKALAAFKKGDTTTVKVKRDNAEQTLPVTFQ